MTSATKYINRQAQGGFSVIEVMVSITISLLLLAGVSQIFLSSKASYNLQSGLGQLQDNARFAMDVLARSISMAGFSNGAVPIAAINPVNSKDNVTENAQLGLSITANNASDVIEVNYTSDTDCMGNATGGVAVDRYYLDGSNLMCLGNGDSNPGIMAEGVDSMQVLYGEDTDNDGYANAYVSADNVVNWEAVASVRLALLMNTVDSLSSTDTKVHYLLNSAPIGPIKDRKIRRIFSRTILLRNQLSA